MRALADLAHEVPTAIQSDAIPAIAQGRDVRACAETGSGKTAAFVLPILERLRTSGRSSGPGARAKGAVFALVLVPTRELAAQVGDAVTAYARHLPERIKTCVVFGGVSENPQMMELRGGADIVVATPGRLLDLVERNAIRLGEVAMLVLDEADRLLSLGFSDELERIRALVDIPQCLLFSATFPPSVRTLADSLLRDPLRIEIEPNKTFGDVDAAISQRAIEVDHGKRTLLLRHLLSTHEWPAVLVFVASRHAAEHVADKLTRAKIAAAPFHGELSQGARTRALADFKEGRIQVLVATDVAGRGLDIVGLPAVVNYDLPRSAVDYLHRIGRTGRGSETGVAVSFVTADTEPHFRLIEKRHRLAIGRERLAGFERTEVATETRDPHGGVKGRRKSKKDKLREAAAGKAKE